jgi:hypothetical protein
MKPNTFFIENILLLLGFLIICILSFYSAMIHNTVLFVVLQLRCSYFLWVYVTHYPAYKVIPIGQIEIQNSAVVGIDGNIRF